MRCHLMCNMDKDKRLLHVTNLQALFCVKRILTIIDGKKGCDGIT